MPANQPLLCTHCAHPAFRKMHAIGGTDLRRRRLQELAGAVLDDAHLLAVDGGHHLEVCIGELTEIAVGDELLL